MSLRAYVACLVACGLAACGPPSEAQAPASDARLFRGARLIVGDGSAPIENGAFLVEGTYITRVGTAQSLVAPDGAAAIDLSGKTVMPALIDGHSHLGYTDVATMSTSSAHYTRENLLDHLHRYAYYGIAVTLSLGLDRGDLPYQLKAERNVDAALFLTAGRGIAMPNAGPRADYWKDAAYGVSTETQARAAVGELAGKKVDVVKIWVDDRDGTVTPLPPSLYRPIIDEAHARGLRVVAHVYYLADAKALLRAGIDGFAHGIRDTEVDDEILALFRERPQVFVMPNLPDRPPAKGDRAWLAETLPAAEIDRLRSTAEETPPTLCWGGSGRDRIIPNRLASARPGLHRSYRLREQLRFATIRDVEMTGHGFYAEFDVPSDVPLAVPARFAGGNAEIVLDLDGAEAGAGCVLFIRDGRLATLEGYTFGDDGWPENARVLAVENVVPVSPS